MTAIETFYSSSYQQPLLVGLPSLVWLLYLFTQKAARDDVWKYCAVFTVVSLLDAVFTSNDVLGQGPLPAPLSTIVPILFVTLGDFRVFLWVLPGSYKSKWPKALGLSLVVPIVSALLGKVLPGAWTTQSRVLYLTYELLFLALFGGVTLWLGGWRGAIRPYCGFVLTYYSLWALADIWLLATDAASTPAWLVRIVANLMYYIGWTPWVYSRVQFSRAEYRDSLN